MSSVLTLLGGDVYIPWREQKGETFTIKLIEEDRVCIGHIYFTLGF